MVARLAFYSILILFETHWNIINGAGVLSELVTGIMLSFVEAGTLISPAVLINALKAMQSSNLSIYPWDNFCKSRACPLCEALGAFIT
jgi:hypothetical protein